MRQRERKPFAKVPCIMPAAGRIMWRAVDIENSVIEVTCVMYAKDCAPTSLCIEERQIAKDDAIVYALANSERWRNLAIRFDLVAAWGSEVAEVCLP